MINKMNTKLIAVAVLATSIGTLVLLNHKDGSAPSFALVGNQKIASKAPASECGSATDVWMCLVSKRAANHQKEWDAAHPAAARKQEADGFLDQFSWTDKVAAK